MGDGKALQMGTSHELGQNFARAFEHRVPRRRPARSRPRGPRRGASSTRMVGGLIMAHGDDDGLRVPPRLAPVQVVVLAVRDEGDVRRALPRAHRRAAPPPACARELDDAHRRVARAGAPPTGSSRACPVRLEVGPRDLADGVVTLVRRITGRRRRAVRCARRRRRRGRRRARAPSRTRCSPRRPRCASAHTVDVDHARRRARRRRRPAGRASRGTRSAPRARPSSRTSGVTVRCLARADGSLPDVRRRARPGRRTSPARTRPSGVTFPIAPPVSPMLAKLDARAARRRRRLPLRAEVGRLPRHRVPRRRRRRDRQPQREAAHALLPRAASSRCARTCPSAASSTARS